ncbi:polyprenol phosphomannose-dependent alpha 1,6 mannosyltransferase MptB [Nocardioides hungaricus]
MIARGVVGSLLVALGGLVTQVLPGSSPVATFPLLAALRESTEGRMTGLVVTMAGLALLGSAWLQLLHRPRQVYVATAAWTLPLLLAPPLFSRDAWSYAAQGALTNIGLSPYIWTPSIFDGQIREAVDPIWMWTPTPYGPLPLAWGSMVAGLTDSPWLMVVGYRILMLLGLALLAWAVPRLARAAGADPDRASVIALASPLTVIHGIGGVHNDLLMAGLMACGLALAIERRWLLGAVFAGAAAAVKVTGGGVAIGIALVSLPLLAAMAARLRRLGTIAVVSSAVIVGAGLAIGVGVGWIYALDTPGLVRTPLSLTTQLGVLVGQVTVLRTLGLVLALGYACWVALRGRTGDPAYAVRAVALVMTAMMVLSPAVHAWYLLGALPFLAAVRWSRPVEGLVRDTALVLGLVAPLDSSLRGAPVEMLVVAGLALVTLVRLRVQAGRREERLPVAA